MTETGGKGRIGIVAAILAAAGALLAYAARLYTSKCVAGDCRNGEGTMRYDDGSTYIGQWRRSKRDGRGTMYYADGGKYVGGWSAGWRDGEGVQYNSDGSIARKGRWKNDHFIDDSSNFS